MDVTGDVVLNTQQPSNNLSEGNKTKTTTTTTTKGKLLTKTELDYKKESRVK